MMRKLSQVRRNLSRNNAVQKEGEGSALAGPKQPHIPNSHQANPKQVSIPKMSDDRYKISNFRYANKNKFGSEETKGYQDEYENESESEPEGFHKTKTNSTINQHKSKIDFSDPKFAISGINKDIQRKRRAPDAEFNDEDIYANAKRRIQEDKK